MPGNPSNKRSVAYRREAYEKAQLQLKQAEKETQEQQYVAAPEGKPLKKRQVIFDVNGQKITVVIKAESSLKTAYDNGWAVYDLNVALENTVSAEEVLEREDPKRNSDFDLYVRPEVRDGAERLSAEDRQLHYENIRDRYRLLACDDIVRAIVESAPKKKNGSLYQKRYTRIAFAPVVSYGYEVFEIVGYAKDDNTLEICGKWMQLEKEDCLGNDLLPLIAHESESANSSSAKSRKSVVEKAMYSVTFSDIDGRKTSKIKFEFTVKNGEMYLGETPVSSLKCLKKNSKDFSIVFDTEAYRSLEGMEFKGSVVSMPRLERIFDYFDVLKNHSYAEDSNQREQWRKNLIKAAEEQNPGKYSFDIKKWPDGIEHYHGSYTKEQSLEKLLLFIDGINAFSREDLLELMDRLPMTKNGENISPNKNYVILSSGFFTPWGTGGLGIINAFEYSGVPQLIIRTPMGQTLTGQPLRSIEFRVSNKEDRFLELPEKSASVVPKKPTTRPKAMPDKDGFIIRDGVLRKYEGVSKEVIIPKGIKAIGKNAFNGSSIRSVTIPEGVELIDKSAFYKCAELFDVTLPDTLVVIEEKAFNWCTGLVKIHLPNSVSKIGNEAFANCHILTEINLPKALENVSHKMFYKCYKLKNIHIPENIKTLGKTAFGCCESITEINIPRSITCIPDEAFIGCTSLSEVTMHEGVTEIGAWSFGQCKNLPEAPLPKNLKKIGDSAFSGCDSFVNVRIPESCTEIWASAFRACPNLRDAYIPGKLEVLGTWAFDCCYGLTIHCPKGSLAEAYAVKDNIRYKTF